MSVISEQEKQALHYLAQGFSKPAAAKAAGFLSASVFERKHMQEAVAEINNIATAEIKVTRNMVTQMLFEAHRKAATATEEISAAREIGKLHGLYESDSRQTMNVNVNVIKDIETLPAEELLQLAEIDGVHTLSPDDYHEVNDGE